MSTKKAISIAISVFLFGMAISPAYAQGQNEPSAAKPLVIHPVMSNAGYVQNKMVVRAQEKMQAMDDKSVSKSADLKTRADNEITRRVTTLQGLINKINLLKKLTADQKSTLSAKVQNEISSLNTLKTKIDADTDQTTLKSDVKSIVQSYRVYLFFVPQINELSALNKIMTVSDDYSVLFGQIQTKLQDMKAKGSDTSTGEASLTDAKAKVADAQNQANKAVSTLETLTPAGYPGNKTTLMQVRTMIKIAMTDLDTARMDIKKIISSMGKSTTPTTTVSAMPGGVTSPVPPTAPYSVTP